MTPVPRPRVAVVGHVEWLTHGRGRMPLPGEITYLTDPIDEPAGGGGVSAAQVAKLGAECVFYTALGRDHVGRLAGEVLEGIGVRVLAAVREGPHTRAVSAAGEVPDRAIAVIGAAASARIEDALPWDELAGCQAAYFTGHDSATLQAARRAGALVVTSRRLPLLIESGVRADVLVASAADPTEAVDPDALPVPPRFIVWTEGAAGGHWAGDDGTSGRWDPVAPPAPPVDSYGCGDSFVAGLTVGLGRGRGRDGALHRGARGGAQCITGRGGLGPQLVEDPTPA
jgi:ribokinase